ncbi:conserved membrane protein of unknown function [Candidatus Hydrogenisulfobacillus filiaventi]|uniref:TIGR04086 family membrane protein n=1 Tax=Candidatus Hydrogenisulfobacillus filiaventi TaxID=2707344 RepID=A0A6F8ZGF0_9FIRM|nr:TIGR04086 family membrane protein [Bacillota bacterium]CAB1128743.1 conserved membrane protein of unknown function [Candidatus Hydrogenisulfobacillus filiaventi]
MDLGAVLRGAGAGLAAAAVLALGLAVTAWNLEVPAPWWPFILLAATAAAAGLAGWVAGRRAPGGGWAHGALAAVTLTLVGLAAGSSLGTGDHHLWRTLATAALAGLVGGVLGVNP